MIRHNITKDEQGFTIIELMIATAVLSTILIMVTFLMVNVGKLYYKGINQARVQDGTRAIADDITQQLKLSDSPPSPGSGWTIFSQGGKVKTYSYCIGTTRYSYVLDAEIGKQQYFSLNPNTPVGPILQHILWRDTIPSGAACVPARLETGNPSSVLQPGDIAGTNGTELIPPNSRLTALSIGTSSPYSLSIGIAYGDDDLMSHNGINSICQGNIGDQFCATANLTTSVTQRLQ